MLWKSESFCAVHNVLTIMSCLEIHFDIVAVLTWFGHVIRWKHHATDGCRKRGGPVRAQLNSIGDWTGLKGTSHDSLF